MLRHLLTGVAAVTMMSGIAFAQNSPMGGPGFPSAPDVGSHTTTRTTTVAPTPEGGYSRSTTRREEGNGHEATETHTRTDDRGFSGSSTETRSRTHTDPNNGETTTRSTTTTTGPR